MAPCFLENRQMQVRDRQRPTNSLSHEQHQVQKGEKGASTACEDLLTTRLPVIAVGFRCSHGKRHHFHLRSFPLSRYFLVPCGASLVPFWTDLASRTPRGLANLPCPHRAHLGWGLGCLAIGYSRPCLAASPFLCASCSFSSLECIVRYGGPPKFP